MCPGNANHPHPLYEYEGKSIFYSDFVSSLEEVGIEKADTVLVHSDISVFGKLCLPDRDLLCKALVDSIKETVGDQGTIIMPTFSYSFCNNEVFDINNTRSTVGVLTEYFRQQPDTSRTGHPIFSVGIWGKHQQQLLDVGPDSFDRDSIFGKLEDIHAKVLFFGAPFLACTHIHYAEQMREVPYRYVKTFTGTFRDGDDSHEATCTYLVRNLEMNVVYDLSSFEKHLRQKGMLKEASVGSGKMLSIDMVDLSEQGHKMMDKNIFCFLKKPVG